MRLGGCHVACLIISCAGLLQVASLHMWRELFACASMLCMPSVPRIDRHGEVVAIRDACKRLGTHVLAGCVLYTSAEPCPMCYASSLWAHVDAIY